MAKEPHAPGDDTIDIEELLAKHTGELSKRGVVTLALLRSLTYLRLLPTQDLLDKAREGGHSALTVVLAERLEDALETEED